MIKLMLNQKGITTIILILGILIILFGIGGFYLFKNTNNDTLLSKTSSRMNQTPTNIAQPSIYPTAIPTHIQSTIDTSNWKTYINQQYGYSVKYPSTLTVHEAKSGVTLNNELGLQEGELQKIELTSEQNYPQPIFIVVRLNNSNQSLDDWAKNYKVITYSGASIATYKGNSALGSQHAEEFIIRQENNGYDEISTIRTNKIYQFSFDGEDPNDPQFNANSAIYNQILKTFKFLDQNKPNSSAQQ